MSISLCNECKNKPICTIYTDISKYNMYANITIDKCEFNKNDTVKNTPQLQKAIDPYTGKPMVDREKINELSNKNRENKNKQKKIDAEKEKPKPKFTATPLELDHTCAGCGATTFKDDAAKCECGKDICSCCATIDSDTKKLLCPDCWQAL